MQPASMVLRRSEQLLVFPGARPGPGQPCSSRPRPGAWPPIPVPRRRQVAGRVAPRASPLQQPAAPPPAAPPARRTRGALPDQALYAAIKAADSWQGCAALLSEAGPRLDAMLISCLVTQTVRTSARRHGARAHHLSRSEASRWSAYLEALAATALARLRTFLPQQLSNVLWGLAKLGWRPGAPWLRRYLQVGGNRMPWHAHECRRCLQAGGNRMPWLQPVLSCLARAPWPDRGTIAHAPTPRVLAGRRKPSGSSCGSLPATWRSCSGRWRACGSRCVPSNTATAAPLQRGAPPRPACCCPPRWTRP